MSNSLKPSSSRAAEVGLHQSHDECPNFQKLQEHTYSWSVGRFIIQHKNLRLLISFSKYFCY